MLSFLDLSCNQIGVGGVTALCEYLRSPHGRFLHHLNLEDNKLGPSTTPRSVCYAWMIVIYGVLVLSCIRRSRRVEHSRYGVSLQLV